MSCLRPVSFTDVDRTRSAYEYDLPSDRIAQNPVVPRDRSKLLVVDAPDAAQHRIFRELPELLQPGDLLVINNTKVIPARLYGRKVGGAAVEILLLEEERPWRWKALVKPGRRLKPGAVIEFGEVNPEARSAPDHPRPLLRATVVETDPDTKGRILEFECLADITFWEALEQLGNMPLPPYITESQAESDQYQTIYASQPGAVAAPTAGLHFTPEVFAGLAAAGIDRADVTLHVGVGTFRPVDVEDITAHTMHAEWVDIPSETLAKITATKARGGRVIAVGTTVVRTLEGVANDGGLRAYQGKTNLFIYPGYEWQVIDGLITNFHLPGSSLMMLVSAMVGRSRLLDLYQTAIAQDYRFYSFGDAMLILPTAQSPAAG